MVRENKGWLRRGLVVLTGTVALLCSYCDATRPGGQVGVTLTPSQSVVLEDGSTVEEYELRQSNPMMAHFVSLGMASHQMLQTSGYAFGTLVRISHSDRDKEYGEGPEREDWFPMVVLLDVVEEGQDDGQEDQQDVTAQYEITLDYDPQTFTSPGLVILEARKLDADGGASVSLEVLPPEPKGFLERNRKGITMMFGVIIASSVVKFMRRTIERLARKAKQDKEERELEKEKGASLAAGRRGGSSRATTAPSTETKQSPKTARGKKEDNLKKKAGNAKQD